MSNRCLGELFRRSPDVWQSAGRAIELGARLPLVPLAARALLIVCGPTAGHSQGAHNQRRLDTVYKDAGVSVLHHRHLPSGYLDASRGRQAPPGQPTRQRSCRPSAAARARGLPTTSTSSSPATSAAGLATTARAVLRRAIAGSRSGQLQGMTDGIFAVHHRFLPPDSGIVGACRPRAWKALAAGEARCCAHAEPRGQRPTAARWCPCGRCAVPSGLRVERALSTMRDGHVLGC
jgi:hypothetical protein